MLLKWRIRHLGDHVLGVGTLEPRGHVVGKRQLVVGGHVVAGYCIIFVKPIFCSKRVNCEALFFFLILFDATKIWLHTIFYLLNQIVFLMDKINFSF